MTASAHTPDVVAIDGPAGAGKGTAAAAVAERLGWRLLDSGAIYRVVGLAALRRGIGVADEPALAALARGLRISFGQTAVVVDGKDEAQAIRAPDVDAAASAVAKLPTVRDAVLETQRGFRLPPGLVADGRDMGTVVFPDARLKVFLTASAEERARRRHRQLKASQPNVSLRALFEAIEARDRADATRAVAPLVAAADAVTIDSSAMSIDAVAASIMALAAERGMGCPGAGGNSK